VATVRCFIGLSISDEIRAGLNRCQEEIDTRLRCKVFKWVRPENIHVTVHFLGNISGQIAASLEPSLIPVCRDQSPFELLLDDIGAFPSLKKPRVLWAGLRNTGGELALMYKLCGAILQKIGVEIDRRAYTPHLTLAYLKKRVNRGDTGAAAEDLVQYIDEQPALSQKKISCTVENLTIFESSLTPQGPVYTPLAVLPLGTA
jgi:RNA 2',3'-cyclic 3'-phosphodiesterase